MVSTDVIASVEMGSSGEDKTAVKRATDKGGKVRWTTEEDKTVRCATDAFATDDTATSQLGSQLRLLESAIAASRA